MLGAAAIGVSAALARPAADAVTITVTARDYGFKLSTKTASAGKVMFAVKNTGTHDHDFQIGGKKTPVLKAGKSATLTVTLAKAGVARLLVDGRGRRGRRG